MAKMPIKFMRVAAAFDEAARLKRPCDSSSGSDYWPESGTDLSDLVNSFIEKGDHGVDHPHNFNIEIDDHRNNEDYSSGHDYGNDICGSDNDNDNNNDNNDDDKEIKRKEMLQDLLLECKVKKKGVKQKLWNEINVALSLIGGGCNSGANGIHVSRTNLKRNVMSHLRDKGFDAGLCKSRWEKTGRFPAGTYEYIDVNAGDNRYVVEVYLAGEFDIVRPTEHYTTLLEMIPSILIIEKPQLLKQLLKLMTSAMRDSLKRANLHVPPWRRNGYMQAKYFSHYKRTINGKSTLKDSVIVDGEELAKKRLSVGFEATHQNPRVFYYCRDGDFGSKVNGVRVGLLAAVLQGT